MVCADTGIGMSEMNFRSMSLRLLFRRIQVPEQLIRA